MYGSRAVATGLLLISLSVMMIVSPNAGAAPKFGDWSTPTNLGPVVNSAVVDQGPAISKEDLSLFFGSNRPGGFGGNDIWVSQRASVDDPWGPPVNLGSVVNTADTEGGPSLSRDGHWLFMNSNRLGGFGLNDVWVSYRDHVHDDFGWQAPVNLGPGVNTAFTDQGASYFENDDCDDDEADDDDDDNDREDDCAALLFFSSNTPGGLGSFDIYVSAQLSDGSWGAAEVVPELSSPDFDIRPTIRFDGLELFLFSGRPGGFGLGDIWVSTRDAVSDPWTTPLNLGPLVNTAYEDVQAYLASDRQTLYFTSNRPGGLGGFDLYVTTRMRA